MSNAKLPRHSGGVPFSFSGICIRSTLLTNETHVDPGHTAKEWTIGPGLGPPKLYFPTHVIPYRPGPCPNGTFQSQPGPRPLRYGGGNSAPRARRAGGDECPRAEGTVTAGNA